MRFAEVEHRAAWEALLADRVEIDREFAAADLGPLDWRDDEVPQLVLTAPSPTPWDASVEDAQRVWLGRAC